MSSATVAGRKGVEDGGHARSSAGGPPPSAPQNGAPSTTMAAPPMNPTASAASRVRPRRTNRFAAIVATSSVEVANRENVTLPIP